MVGNDRGRYNSQRRNAIFSKTRFRGRLGGQGGAGGGDGGREDEGNDNIERAESDPGSYGGGGGGAGHHYNNKNTPYHQRNKNRVTFKHSAAPNSRYKYTNNRQLGQRILKDQDNDTVMRGEGTSASLHQDFNRSTLSQRLARNITRRTTQDRYSVRNRQQQGAQPLLRIGETNSEPAKPLVASQPYCKLNGVDQAVFDYCVQFLKQYFTCFDQNREELLAAYHRKAIFSISINSNSKAAQTGPKFGEYFTSSRNLLHVTTTDKCHKMLHIGNIDIVAFINKFPTTEHNFDSFKLDISYFTANMLKLSVIGLFKEGSGKTDKVQPMRSFHRVFVCVPIENGRVAIVNDQLTISHMPVDQSKMRKEEILPRENPSQPQTSPQQQMIAQFSRETNLNNKWSRDCLEFADWDYNKAVQSFLEHKSNIPAEAFVQ